MFVGFGRSSLRHCTRDHQQLVQFTLGTAPVSCHSIRITSIVSIQLRAMSTATCKTPFLYVAGAAYHLHTLKSCTQLGLLEISVLLIIICIQTGHHSILYLQCIALQVLQFPNGFVSEIFRKKLPPFHSN